MILITELYIKKFTITLKFRSVRENSSFIFQIRYAELIGYLSSLKTDEAWILLISFGFILLCFILSKTTFTRRDGVLQLKCQSLGLEGSIMGYKTQFISNNSSTSKKKSGPNMNSGRANSLRNSDANLLFRMFRKYDCANNENLETLCKHKVYFQ